MNLIRGSEISSFLKCRKQWQYAWYENIVPKRPDNKVFFGTLIHKFLEVYYTSLSTEEALEAMQQLFVNTDTTGMQQFEIDDLWDLVVKVSEHYVKQWQDKNAKRSVIATELRFAVQLYGEYYYEGTIDLLYEEDGRLYFSDYKNTSSIDRYLSMAKMDRQISRYWWALQQLARGNGLIWYAPDDKWIPVDIWENMTVEGRKLKEPTGFVYDIILPDVYNPCYRNITADCSWCSYQSLCLVELDGGNVELTKNIAYTKKEM